LNSGDLRWSKLRIELGDVANVCLDLAEFSLYCNFGVLEGGDSGLDICVAYGESGGDSVVGGLITAGRLANGDVGTDVDVGFGGGRGEEFDLTEETLALSKERVYAGGTLGDSDEGEKETDGEEDFHFFFVFGGRDG